VVDNHDLNRTLLRLQLQPELPLYKRKRLFAAVGFVARFMFDAGQKISGVDVEMAVERELVAGGRLAAVAFSFDADSQNLFLRSFSAVRGFPITDICR